MDVLKIKMGRDVLFNFLRAEHLLIKPKRSYIKTTNSKHWMKKHPNLIKGIDITRPEQLWVSDITYIKTNKGHGYLSLITDAYSKKIMGYNLGQPKYRRPIESSRTSVKEQNIQR